MNIRFIFLVVCSLTFCLSSMEKKEEKDAQKQKGQKKDLISMCLQPSVLKSHVITLVPVVLSRDERVGLWQLLMEYFSQADEDKKIVVRSSKPREILSKRNIAALIFDFLAIEQIVNVHHRSTVYKVGQFRWSQGPSM